MPRTRSRAGATLSGTNRSWALACLFSPSVKSYFLRYRTPEGRERRATIGQNGAWTPDQARAKADEWRQLIKAGGDPLAEKQQRREAPTVGDVLDAYLTSERFADKAASTQTIDRGRIERHLRPLLGRRLVHTLTDNDIKRAFSAIREGKTAADVRTRKRGRARVTGGEGAARMAVGLLRAAFSWAVCERLLKSNPAEHFKTGPSGVREVILEDADAYARLFKTLDRMERERRLRAAAADAIRVIALTGARRGEIAGLCWSHVELQRARIVLPPRSHKTGRKTGRPRIIDLPSAAQAIIARQPARAPEDFVFAPARGQGALALSKDWRKIRVEAELPGGIGLHGLRHSLASHMAMMGAQAAEIMTALGHRQLSTAQRYVHWAADARQAVAEKAASVALAGLAAADKAQADGQT
jgi:integrase